jgi:hypothetical protein
MRIDADRFEIRMSERLRQWATASAGSSPNDGESSDVDLKEM